jgi:hypothetical protein
MRPDWAAAGFALLVSASAAAAETRIDAWPARGEPFEDYERAVALFADGDRKVATCLFYRGQFRARVYLAARPGLPPDGAPALYAALNDVVGTEINLWAGGDVGDWTEAMECALRWAETSDDPVTPRADHADEYRRVAAGLRDLIDHVRANAEGIRAERAARGLENR